MAFTYMLRCSDGSFYVGSTRKLEQRLHEHAAGQGAAYTRTRLPVELVWCEEHENIGAVASRTGETLSGPDRQERGLDTVAARPTRPTSVARPA